MQKETRLLSHMTRNKSERDSNVHKFQTEEVIQDSFNDQEAMGVWKVIKNDAKGRKVYQHLITGEIVPNIPPYDSRDAERVLENKATKYIVDSVGVRDRERKRKYLEVSKYVVGFSRRFLCVYICSRPSLEKVDSEKALQNLTSKIPRNNCCCGSQDINETTNMVEKCGDSTTVSEQHATSPGDQDVATGETIKEGDDKNSENEKT